MTGAAEPARVADPVATNLGDVRARIVVAAAAVGRDPAGITLVAVSKAQLEARVKAALAAGQRVFGENYMQEA
ncbi:MAG TPA: YggS family pyridoxal phosphate-dependent enzyme, partial [Geminicoccaceae bacterium]|nr:YggS family pyridoxal phosphate-dependent enzyme [Geminicoccaceae bacterium]